MENITSIEQYKEIIEGEGSVLMFSAGWCPDCTVIEPLLPVLEETHSDLNFYKINRDNFIELCQDLDIFGIPSFLVFREGQELGRFVSKNRKTMEEIDVFLTKTKQE